MARGSRLQPASPESLDLSGRRVGDYQLLRKLGQGGMGQVYLAEQLALKRKVALKVLRSDMASSPVALARFKLEAEAVAKATHANIVQVYDYGEADGLCYMALEYVEGRNLKDFISKKGPPELLIALSIMRQVASALQRASELGITHRDIKPENILLTRKGEVKVADFGLSRDLEDAGRPALNLTQTGVTMGTPLYMAPEQAEGKPVDPRTDIYSFGATCYHMFTGNPPFRGETAIEVALAHVQREPTPMKQIRPDLPEGLSAIVHKMMAKSPDKRYQTARELSREIIRLRESLTGVNPAPNTMAQIQVEPALLNTIIPPDESVIRSGKGSETAISSPPVEAPAPAAPRGPRRAVLAGAVGLSLVMAMTGGAAFGWRERATEGPLPTGEDLRPADAVAGERVPRPSRRERVLSEAAEQYLSQAKGRDPRPGFGACMDLGLFYLDAGRLDDAEALFQRLEKFNTVREFKGLGQIGLAVVLAMRHRPKESNGMLKDLFTMHNPKSKPPKEKLKPTSGFEHLLAGKRAEVQIGQIRAVLNHPRWHYYLARARYLNATNGLKDDDMPPLFLAKVQELDLPRKKG
ncbi:MAG: protein kinase domain-containing protein [Gemmataceae bacterium]